jgi:pimeloyl-ACP methyl ester carboxylesterase
MPKMAGPQEEIRKIVSAKARGVEAVASVDPKFLDGTFLQDLNRDPDRLGRAARLLDIPVLFIGGEFSRYRAEATAAALREDIPHVEIEYVPGGHLVARDCPADVNRLLARFIRGSWPQAESGN